MPVEVGGVARDAGSFQRFQCAYLFVSLREACIDGFSVSRVDKNGRSDAFSLSLPISLVGLGLLLSFPPFPPFDIVSGRNQFLLFVSLSKYAGADRSQLFAPSILFFSKLGEGKMAE